MEDIYALRPGELQDDYLYRLGCLKEAGTIQLTWSQLAGVLNSVLRQYVSPWDESSWRKRFRKLQQDPPQHTHEPEPEIEDLEEEESQLEDNDLGLNFDDVDETPTMLQLSEIRRQRQLIQDIRSEQNRVMRQAARAESLQEIMRQEIRRFEPPEHVAVTQEPSQNHAIYAMLSDIHYGIQFSNKAGSYDSDIATTRVMQYAEDICQLGFGNDIDTVYVSLMGDMISGNIHQTIRLENREDLVRQVIGASELAAAFLLRLSKSFANVYVNSVPGNHSRVDKNYEDATRGEKLDDLVTWFCKTKLERVTSVHFVENEIDSTIGMFNIFGKSYVCVHGDFDNDLAVSAMRIQRLIRQDIDYMLAGHMHVPNFRFEHTGYIRNGSVCGSGDEYTVKKRLYSPPYQVCMIISENGVDSIHPIRLDKNEEGAL